MENSNRIIKFRAWDKKNKKWIGKKTLEYLCISEDVVVLVEYTPDSMGGYSPKSCKQLTSPEVQNLEIVEYIGKKDENDREIYEGSILKDDRGQYGKVFYSDKSASFLVNWKMEDGSWETDCCFHEVVGHIYENPELLKK